MISILEAQKIVAARTPARRRVARRPIEEAVGHALAEDIVSRVDLPPFDRVMMDGFAVRSGDIREVPAVLRLVGEIAAGDSAEGHELREGEAVHIFTGAPLPEGADAVVPLEEAELTGHGEVVLKSWAESGQHIAPRGQDLKDGELAIPRGAVVSVASVGLLAALGYRDVAVFEPPEVAILTTGNELVEPSQALSPGKIRDTNRFALAAQVRAAGGQPRLLGVAPDERNEMRTKIEQGLLSDILLITGGSSVGRYDFAHEVVEQLGCERHFNRVAIKPGRPTVFFTHGERLVFCIPGNPVSAFVTFDLFVRLAVEKLAGMPPRQGPMPRAVLTDPLRSPPDRSLALIAELGVRDGKLLARPIPWHGSGDQVALARAEALIVLEPDESRKAGDLVAIHTLATGARGLALRTDW
ncbi:MAG: gephyrin-like molybdotransferase Glp [Planctomycetota bacterium]